MAYNYSNTAVQTTLNGAINNSVTTVVVASASGFPASYPYSIVVDYGQPTLEVMSVTNASGTTLTVTRGQDGTSAQSHSDGVPVVHALVARDVRDPSLHMDASTDVHGLSGGAAVVGTSQTQTLTNKTINGGSNTLSNVPASAITGSFSTITTTGSVSVGTDLTAAGNATITGNANVTGSATITGNANVTGNVIPSGQVVIGGSGSAAKIAVQRAAAGDDAISTRVSGDTVDKLTVDSDGRHWWGSGGGAVDTNLYRSQADMLATDDHFKLTDNTKQILLGDSGGNASVAIQRVNASDLILSGQVGSETERRFRITTDGKQEWGDGSTAVDTNLYRSAADTLKTDDQFISATGISTAVGAIQAERAVAGDDAFRSLVTGDSVHRFVVDADGRIEWGPGGASSRDTNLFRESANVLRTNDAIKVDGYLTQGNVAHGVIQITPSAPSTPTSGAVSGLSLTSPSGAYIAQVSASSTAPNQVEEVSVSGPNSGGVTVWVSRTNTTATNIFWSVIGI